MSARCSRPGVWACHPTSGRRDITSSSARSWSGDPRAASTSALEEPHLPPGQLHHVVVVQPSRLRTDGYAIDLGKVVFFAAVHMDDEVAFGAPGDGSHLDARAPERGERLRQFELASGECTAEHLQLRLRQCGGVLRYAA